MREHQVIYPYTEDQWLLMFDLFKETYFKTVLPADQLPYNDFTMMVMLPECFILHYSQEFGVDRSEAESMINDTPWGDEDEEDNVYC